MIGRPPSSPLFPSPPLSRPPRLHCRAREHDAPHPFARQGVHGHRHREVRLPSARRANADHDIVLRDRLRSEEHTSELQSRLHLVCRLLLEKKKKSTSSTTTP